ncbi:MAG: hypothetical protein JSV91_14620 [Phycisphaerales bacterium]|nr:MAG: hypothetical protein JSV91_14620 [Phycisphaerales bacterium]
MQELTIRETGFRMSRVVALAIMAVACGVTGAAHAQLSDADIEALRKRGEAEGWTFTVSRNAAARRPMSELCGTILPDDWARGARFVPMDPREDLPIAFDWRDHNGCTPVKDQDGCGSCWAFSAVGSVECAIAISDSVVVDLSEQWLISCTNAGSCSGGQYTVSFDHFTCFGDQDPCGDSGAVLEEVFPYEAANVNCGCPYPHSYCLDGWAYVDNPRATVEEIKQAIYDNGPLSTCVYVNSAFAAYSGGVFNACDDHTINHAVVLVGWDDEQGTEGVWIMRNSWGTDWGENGYMRIEYGCSRIGTATAFVQYSRHGLGVSPIGGFVSVGPNGGPFSPGSADYTLHNYSEDDLEYSVTKSAQWLDLSSTGGTLAPDESIVVTVSINAGANTLDDGYYVDSVDFVNETDHLGDTRRNVGLDVGDWCSTDTGKVLASDGAELDWFGRSLAIEGSVAIVGAPRDDNDQGPEAGAAYVLRNNGTVWEEEKKLLSFERDADDEFGWSVDISGDAVLVGAFMDDTNGPLSGSAYVFRYDGAEWIGEAKLLASDGTEVDEFGYAVAVDGDVAIIGAPGDSDQGTYAGSAYIFRYDGEFWVEEAKLLAFGRSDNDFFGWAVDIEGDVAVVGAPHSPYYPAATGSAYVFRYDGSQWTEELRLEAGVGREGDMFGYAIALSGDALIVGAPARNDDTSEDQVGSAFIYRFDGTDWFEEAHLIASDGLVEDEFGSSVTVLGEFAMVGAPGKINDAIVPGSAYVFQLLDEAWVEHDRLAAIDGEPGDSFGAAVGLADIAVIVGASRDDDLGVDAGAAYVFSLGDKDCNSNGADDYCDIFYGYSFDCNGNDIPDECDIADGASDDMNQNGIPDECESLDCNGNGVPDHWDIMYGMSYDCDEDGVPDECGDDCNGNGIADVCDIDPDDPDGNGLVSEDCNNDAVPDECLSTTAYLELSSGELSPIGNGSPQSFIITDLSEVLEDVVLTFTAFADLDLSSEWIDVSINGTDVGRVFEDDGAVCPDIPDEAELTVPMALFNSLIAGGQDAVITMTASEYVNANACNEQSYITVSFGSLAEWNGLINPVELGSGELSPIGHDSPQSFVIANAPGALEDVVLSFTAYADLSVSAEWIDVDINGTWIDRLFADDAEDCADPPDEAELIVPRAVFNSLVEPGQDAVITMTASEDVSDSACGGESFISLSVSYLGLWYLDLNGNGIPDDCECPGDLDGNGKVNIDDLFLVLGKWGLCDGCPEDFNFDGKVNIDDLFFILNHWGPCPD